VLLTNCPQLILPICFSFYKYATLSFGITIYFLDHQQIIQSTNTMHVLLIYPYRFVAGLYAVQKVTNICFIFIKVT